MEREIGADIDDPDCKTTLVRPIDVPASRVGGSTFSKEVMVMEELAVKEDLEEEEASPVNKGLVNDGRETAPCSRILCWTLRFGRGVASASVSKSILVATGSVITRLLMS